MRLLLFRDQPYQGERSENFLSFSTPRAVLTKMVGMASWSSVSTVPPRGPLVTSASKLWYQLSSRSPQVRFPSGKLRADDLDDSEGKGQREVKKESEWVEEAVTPCGKYSMFSWRRLVCGQVAEDSQPHPDGSMTSHPARQGSQEGHQNSRQLLESSV